MRGAKILVMSLPLSFGLILALASASKSESNQTSIDQHLRSRDFSSTSPLFRPAVSSSIQAGTFLQALDHTDPNDHSTFTQRYWVDSRFAKDSGAPVLLHICGEASGEYFLDDSVSVWAKILGARVVYLEHRYYGDSLPFPDFSTAHLKYLTLKNIIEDLANFQKSISSQSGWTGKWISVGGSYSGTLSALYRFMHPELVVGALAASAPMIAGQGDLMNDPSDIDDLSDEQNGDRPWAYQACTTFGFWLADGGSASGQLQFPGADLCQLVFKGAPYVDILAYNQNYNEPFLANLNTNGVTHPTHILFTYGTNDVWTKLGLSAPSNLNAEIQIRMIGGAGHHFDLNAPSAKDSTGVIAARAEFLRLSQIWLAQP